MIARGNEILNAIRKDAYSNEEIQQLVERTNQWLQHGRSLISSIYISSAVYETVLHKVPAKLEKGSNAQITVRLEEVIRKQIGTLNRISRQTRKYDARQNG
jgi:hypothetical protein